MAETEYLSKVLISSNLATVVFCKLPANLYQREREKNVFTNKNSEYVLLLGVS